jgi:predicted transcriptional regulator
MIIMNAVKQMRKDVKKYIDTADDKVVKMVHAMLEVDAEAGWWDAMPDEVKADIEVAIGQADRGEVLSHEEVKKKYPQWFTK